MNMSQSEQEELKAKERLAEINRRVAEHSKPVIKTNLGSNLGANCPVDPAERAVCEGCQ